MFDLATPLPARSPDLALRPLGDGRYVVKNPRTGDFYQLGAEEHFLLTQLDGNKDAATVCEAFAESFGQALSEEDLEEFLETAREQGLLQQTAESEVRNQESGVGNRESEHSSVLTPGQSILYWRRSIFDPDRLFTWLAPKIRFFWTRAFLVLSAGSILFATALIWANRHELASSFQHALRWETVVLAWITLLLVTMLHEFAHGLTCKHHGGEVHEIGFLLMFLMPCLYCNVSDAWLFREKSKRLWVTFAGGYFELFLWALAVFAWRLTMPDTLINYLAFVVLTLCGVQTLFNFNPLIKLDGYYLLSDWLEIPNLRQRALDRWTAQLRCLLWGAPRPSSEPRGRLLLVFGGMSWVFSFAFLVFVLVGLIRLVGSRWGLIGFGLVALVGLVCARTLFQGFSTGEVRKMILTRHKRMLVWSMTLAVLGAFLRLVEIEDRASGTFQVRACVRAELRAPVAGFVKEIYYDEGDRVSPGARVARLEVPDLESRLAQKQAEVREAQARLRLLEIGPRPEEVAELGSRVERALAWKNLANEDLAHSRQALQEELGRLDKQVVQYRAEFDAAQDVHDRSKSLRSLNAVSHADNREAERQLHVADAQLAQAEFEKRRREALGTREAITGLDAEAELARREKDLADARGRLALLQAGSRPEEIEAARAHLDRLTEEFNQLQQQQHKQAVTSPVSGLVTTTHLKEMVGQYLHEGDLICLLEEPTRMAAEIVLKEQYVPRVQPGHPVALKARALPFETLIAKVERIAPAAGAGDVQSTVTIYCRLQNTSDLRPGMTGHARIYTGRRSIGQIAADRALRFLRTEFWFWW